PAVADERTRLLVVTEGNLRHSHLYVSGHYDFFPPECIRPGPATDRQLEIYLDGLDEAITTEIAMDARSAKPRGIFKERGALGRFFKPHKVSAGSTLPLQRLGARRYRLSLHAPRANGRRPTAAEFFSGIGLVRLALEGEN